MHMPSFPFQPHDSPSPRMREVLEGVQYAKNTKFNTTLSQVPTCQDLRLQIHFDSLNIGS